MAFVIATGCCNDASCVDVCPVDCIRPHPDDPGFATAEQLYIDPSSCIGCAACMYACPVGAIHDEYDMPEEAHDFVALGREYFAEHPLVPRFVLPPTTSEPAPLRLKVAVIGSGPAGCYTAAELSDLPGVEVTLIDRLPTPFGLVRSGVAPDHPDTKLVDDIFEGVLDRDSVTCHLNVEVGTDVTLDELAASHHAVVYAGGASGGRRPGLDGDDLRGSHLASELVRWYNGHPDGAGRVIDLDADTAVIVGNGNVALDVARLLALPPDALAATDVADHALEALRRSAVREVVVAARRGPADAACSYAELLRLSRTPRLRVRTVRTEVDVDPGRPLGAGERRRLDLFRRLALDEPPRPDLRTITFRFGVEPVIIGSDQVEAVALRPAGGGSADGDVIPAGLVLWAIGYQVEPLAGLPFDAARGTVSNVGGRVVLDGTSTVVPGRYCVGWAKRGPSGTIGTNRACARETVAALLGDLEAGRLPEPTESAADLGRRMAARQVDVVGVAGWRAIDARERSDGAEATPARPRRKLVRRDELLAAARPASVDLP